MTECLATRGTWQGGGSNALTESFKRVLCTASCPMLEIVVRIHHEKEVIGDIYAHVYLRIQGKALTFKSSVLGTSYRTYILCTSI